MWLNKQGIRNLFSVPWLEKERYRVVYDTLKESVVIAPDGTKIKFKWDPGICNHMPYITYTNPSYVVGMHPMNHVICDCGVIMGFNV